MSTKPNESAFAAINPDMPASSFRGLTKREYMATQIIAGLAANPSQTSSEFGLHPEWLAVHAVDMADALIEALNKE